MSETIWTKVADFIGSIIKPDHLITLIAVVSGVLLFDIFSLSTNLKIDEDVNKYKFWIALAFFLCSGVKLFGLAASIVSRLCLFAKRMGKTFSASRVKLSNDAIVVLELLYLRRPDKTRLRREHPAVRELRLNRLIYSHSFMENEFMQYESTEIGLAVRKHAVGPPESLDDDALVKFLAEVTGDTCIFSPNPWMAC